MKASPLITSILLLLATSVIAADKPKPPGNDILEALNNGQNPNLGEPAVPRGELALHAHLLTHFDIDKSGDLNAREREFAIIAIRDRAKWAAQGKQPKLTEQQVVQMFDADNSGNLDINEYQTAGAALNKILGEGAAQRIANQGRDGGQGQGGERARRGMRRGFDGFDGRGGNRGGFRGKRDK